MPFWSCRRPCLGLISVFIVVCLAGQFCHIVLQIGSFDDASPAQLGVRQQHFAQTAVTRIGTFFQVANASIWPDMLSCLVSVADAEAGSVDVHLHLSSLLDSDAKARIIREVNDLERSRDVRVFVLEGENIGLDIGPFLFQLRDAYQKRKLMYEVVLKMHSKSDVEWRNLGMQSLCGSKFQVRSIVHNFAGRPLLDLVAPVGTVFDAQTRTVDIAPVIVDKYFQGASIAGEGVFAASQSNLEFLFKRISPEHEQVDVPLVVVAGSMFWVRFGALKLEALVQVIPEITGKLSQGYVQDGSIEHALERFIPSLILRTGRQIAHMAPAPKVMAIYFPQYHQFPENDRFWGKGFTEWSLLKPFKSSTVRKPLGEDSGGLGYYDLTNKLSRQKQGDLARQYGVHGFMFYHYWFSGPGIRNNSVMWKVPHLRIQDGEPNTPFIFSWANEPWNRRWNGLLGQESLLPQEYGDEKGWREHFKFLAPYFKHDQYIKIGNKPVFTIYRPGHLGYNLQPMMELWSQMARDDGFKGIYFVATVGNFYNEIPADTSKLFHASFHFVSTCPLCEQDIHASTASDLPYVRERKQFWGAFTGFDNSVRGGTTSYLVSPTRFRDGLLRSFESMCKHPERRLPDNYFFVAAWNEWNEQNVLEPDDKLQFGYLQALRYALEHIPAAEYKWCNWRCYLHRYGDLSSVFGSNVTLAQKHWLQHGSLEKRSCTCND